MPRYQSLVIFVPTTGDRKLIALRLAHNMMQDLMMH